MPTDPEDSTGTDAPDALPADRTQPVRVLIVDADRRVRASLHGLLAACEGVEVIATTGDAAEAARLVATAAPDVIVLDPRLPEIDAGLQLIARLCDSCPEVRVVAMSVSDTLESSALATGAVAFVAKSGQPSELLDAVLGLVEPRSARVTATSVPLPAPDARPPLALDVDVTLPAAALAPAAAGPGAVARLDPAD
jgi:DNA-binding NarL/FixJ family response regulator